MKDNLKILSIFFIILYSLSDMAYAEDRDYSKAVIHHTASHDVSVETINQWHLERGWKSIGYHFVIRASGSIEIGRDYDKQGAHAKGRNNYTGIALTGYNEFTSEQVESLEILLNMLDLVHVERHHDKCPGKGLILK